MYKTSSVKLLTFLVEVINSKRQLREKLGNVVKITFAVNVNLISLKKNRRGREKKNSVSEVSRAVVASLGDYFSAVSPLFLPFPQMEPVLRL